jgi:hypothetical protein
MTRGLASHVRATITTPGDWLEIDLDPATRHRSIRSSVRRAVARTPSLAGHAVRMIRTLDRITRDAIEAGGFYCTSLVVEDTTGGCFVATLLMQVCREAEYVAPEHLPSALERCAGLTASVSKDPSWTGAEVTDVTLPFVGPSVRICITERAVSVQYLVPLPYEPLDVVLTFTCPCPPYVKVATELFDTMASSLVLYDE